MRVFFPNIQIDAEVSEKMGENSDKYDGVNANDALRFTWEKTQARTRPGEDLQAPYASFYVQRCDDVLCDVLLSGYAQ